MKKSWGIAAKLSIFVFISAMMLLSALVYYNFSDTQKMLKTSAGQASAAISSALDLEISGVAEEIENILLAVSKYGGFSSRWVLYKDSVDSRRLYAALGEQLTANRNVLGIGVLLDPYSWEELQDDVKHAPFVVRSGDNYAITDLADFDPNYLESNIYSLAKNADSPVWGNPFFVSDVNAGAVTCSYPFQNGVIICDVSTDWLKAAVGKLQLPYDGGVIVRTADSRLLADTAGIGKTVNFPEAESIRDIAELTLEGKQYLLSAAQSRKTGWFQAVVFPSDTLAGIAKKSSISILISGILGALLLSLLTYLMSSHISKSLKRLNDSILTIRDKGLDSEVPRVMGGSFEIETISESVEAMRSSLKSGLEDFRENFMTVEAKRCEANIAESILDGYLKKTFPEDSKYSLAAKLGDSSGIEGDFYDFMPTDRGSLYLVLGRVSSSDIVAPAVSNSLLSYLRAILRGWQSPAVALNIIAESLDRGDCGSSSNGEVALILVEFYPSTGTCTLANAGIGRPLLVRDGSSSFIDIAEGSAINSQRRNLATGIFNLAKGDRLLFYTGNLEEFSKQQAEGEPVSASAAINKFFAGLDGSVDSLQSLLEKLLKQKRQDAEEGDAEKEHGGDLEKTAFMLLHYK